MHTQTYRHTSIQNRCIEKKGLKLVQKHQEKKAKIYRQTGRYKYKLTHAN